MPYLDTPVGSLYHEDAGAGEPVLLLHGGACSLENMREIAELLARTHRVLAFERSGHGRTADTDGEYTFAGMLAETVAYLDAVGVGPVHVVGFSDGGIVALLLARDHPDRVRSLVPISANMSVEGAFVPDDYPHETLTEEALAVVRRDAERLSPDGPDHPREVIAKLGRLWDREPDIAPESLAAVTAPALVLRGEHDVISRAHSEAVAAALRAPLFEVTGTTHMLVSEKPREVAATVLAFLGTV
jgi:pimeloyl-ACP methyl ester carboxylesterase